MADTAVLTATSRSRITRKRSTRELLWLAASAHGRNSAAAAVRLLYVLQNYAGVASTPAAEKAAHKQAFADVLARCRSPASSSRSPTRHMGTRGDVDMCIWSRQLRR